MTQLLLLLLIPSLALGQLLRIELFDHVIIYPHDILILILLVLQSKRSVFKKVIGALSGRYLWVTILFMWLLLANILQIWFFQAPLTQLLYILRLTVYGMFLWWFAQYCVNHRPSVTLFRLLGVFFAVITLGMYVVFPDLRSLKALGWDDHFYRAVGTLLDPNFSAAILVVAFFTYLSWYWQQQKKTLMLLLPSLSLLIPLGLTFSRSGWLTWVITYVFFLLLLFKFKKINLSSSTSIQPVLIFIVSVLILFSSIFLAPKPGGEGVDLSRTASIVGRQERELSIARAPISRLIIGTGLIPPPLDSTTYHAVQPNSSPMQLIAFGGIPALVITLIILVKVLKRLWINNSIVLVPIGSWGISSLFNTTATEPFVLLLCGTMVFSTLYLKKSWLD